VKRGVLMEADGGGGNGSKEGGRNIRDGILLCCVFWINSPLRVRKNSEEEKTRRQSLKKRYGRKKESKCWTEYILSFVVLVSVKQ